MVADRSPPASHQKSHSFPVGSSQLFTVPLTIFVFFSLYHCVYLIYLRRRTTASRPLSERSNITTPIKKPRTAARRRGGA